MMQNVVSLVCTILMIVAFSLIPALMISAFFSLKRDNSKYRQCIRLPGWSLNSRRIYVFKNEARGWFFRLVLCFLSINVFLVIGIYLD
jgi:hypothetical protein